MKKKSLVGKVMATDYDLSGDDCPHSPATTIKNLRRYEKILGKMRKAGITEDEIHFLADLNQADALHVFKLAAASDTLESKRRSAN